MKCPRCATFGKRDVDGCLYCGFRLSDLYDQLGAECVVLGRITDNSLLLKVSEKQAIEESMADLENSFPQIFLLVYIGEIPSSLSLAEFGFWLLNHAAVTSLDFTRPNENGLLLVLDLERSQASITAGYFIEQFLPESQQWRCLSKCAGFWEEGALATGLSRFVKEIGIYLAKSARKFAVVKTSVIEPGPVDDNLNKLGLKRLRENHKAPALEKEPLKDPDSLGSENKNWWLDPE